VTEASAAVAVALCESCDREAPELLVVDNAKLCATCAETSARIDRLLPSVASDDPVMCDGCQRPVDFDARVALITRECGGVVLCDHCTPTFDGAIA
jgi:hypothetical protein